METAIDKLYNGRKDFCIVSLTGLPGSGCSGIAKMMSDKDFFLKKKYEVRLPDSIRVTVPRELNNTEIFNSGETEQTYAAISQLVFKRKYTICYDYLVKHYDEFTLIKYNKVIWLYVFCYFLREANNPVSTSIELQEAVTTLLRKAYHPSYKDQDYWEHYSHDVEGVINCIHELCDWSALFESLSEIASLVLKDIEMTDEQRNKLKNIFFGTESALSTFYTNFNQVFSHEDYYCFVFFYHRLGTIIRSTGNLEIDIENDYLKEVKANDNIFALVEVINKLIKSLKNNQKKEPIRRVCIDSLRNSLESQFLKDRYAAYYMVAVNDDKRKEHLFEKIYNRATRGEENVNEERIAEMQRLTEALCQIEAETTQFEKGEFSGPNIAQCITDAEIHLVQPDKSDVSPKPMEFYSVGEQWLKFASLILHPGLITPSAQERCMEMAFTAKLNSGCISRQVGAVITNKYHTVRTIGWNDVPYGQIPCSLREIEGLLPHSEKARKNAGYSQYMYTSFELSDQKYGKYKKLRPASFKDLVGLKFAGNIDEYTTRLSNLPHSYCFKSLHNEFLNDKNQVFTRSLHAEENAMMQMVKFGGEGLMDGIIYVTASPCELCSKKLYQLGVRKIVYIDPYPGIAREQIIACGFRRPNLQLFKGAYGSTYYKLYQPFISYKDEQAIRFKDLDKQK